MAFRMIPLPLVISYAPDNRRLQLLPLPTPPDITVTSCRRATLPGHRTARHHQPPRFHRRSTHHHPLPLRTSISNCTATRLPPRLRHQLPRNLLPVRGAQVRDVSHADVGQVCKDVARVGDWRGVAWEAVCMAGVCGRVVGDVWMFLVLDDRGRLDTLCGGVTLCGFVLTLCEFGCV